MTYLIGEGSPTFVGMAVLCGYGAPASRSSAYGQLRYTVAVYAASCFSVGTGTTDSAPARVVPMYGYGRLPVLSGLAPLRMGLAFVCSPLPTPTRSGLLSGVRATAVGYHPVGMKPTTWLLFGSRTSMTATQLLSALATYSILPSGATASAAGVLPSGAFGNSAV